MTTLLTGLIYGFGFTIGSIMAVLLVVCAVVVFS